MINLLSGNFSPMMLVINLVRCEVKNRIFMSSLGIVFLTMEGGSILMAAIYFWEVGAPCPSQSKSILLVNY